MTSNDLKKYRAFRDRLLELGEVEPRAIDELFDNAIALKRLLAKEMTAKRKPTSLFLKNNLTSSCDRIGWLEVSFEDDRIAFSRDGYEFDF
ncbi:MAG: hypothetical protein WBA24_02325 [Geitlerinemataceae cyanobacterium]